MKNVLKIAGGLFGFFVFVIILIAAEKGGKGTGYHEGDELCRGSTCTQMITEDTLRGKRTCFITTDKLLGTRDVNCAMTP